MSSANPWRCTLYPFAGNSSVVHREQLSYCGVPSALLFRPDMSLAALLASTRPRTILDPHHLDRKNRLPLSRRRRTGPVPRRRRKAVGRRGLCPAAATLPQRCGQFGRRDHSLVRNWIKVNRYQVEPLKVRTRREGLRSVHQGPRYRPDVARRSRLSDHAELEDRLRRRVAAERLARLPALRADGRRRCGAAGRSPPWTWCSPPSTTIPRIRISA